MDIQVTQILFQALNFSVVLGALLYLVYKPVLKALDQRSKKILESQKAADEILKQKDDLDKKSEKILNQAKKQASDILDEAKQSASKKEKQLVEEARKEVESYKETEKTKWAAQQKQLLADLKKEMTESVFVVSEKVLPEVLTEKQHKSIVDKSISEILANIAK